MGGANLLESHRPLTPFTAAEPEDDVNPNETYHQSHSENEIQDAVHDIDVPG